MKVLLFRILVILVFIVSCSNVKQKNVNYEDIVHENATIGSDTVSKIKWIKLNNLVKYYVVKTSNSKASSNDSFIAQVVGRFHNLDPRYTPIENDSVVQLSFQDMSLLILDSAFFKNQKKGEYLFCVGSEVMYVYNPWLLYTILVTPKDKGATNTQGIRKELEKMNYIEKVIIDTMKVDWVDSLSKDYRPMIYLKAILKNKKVTMDEAKDFSTKIGRIKDVERASFNEMFTGPGRTETVYKIVCK